MAGQKLKIVVDQSGNKRVLMVVRVATSDLFEVTVHNLDGSVPDGVADPICPALPLDQAEAAAEKYAMRHGLRLDEEGSDAEGQCISRSS